MSFADVGLFEPQISQMIADLFLTRYSNPENCSHMFLALSALICEIRGSKTSLHVQPNSRLIHLDRQGKQAGARAGALNAQARVRFVDGAVGLAEKVFAVLSEELVVVEIQTDGDVAAAVFISNPLVFQTGEESFPWNTVLGVFELEGLSSLQCVSRCQ